MMRTLPRAAGSKLDVVMEFGLQAAARQRLPTAGGKLQPDLAVLGV